MRTAIKNKKKIVTAYQLGTGTNMEKNLINEGSIRICEDGSYELFSKEAVNGCGEIAKPGDYFKVSEADGKFYPYPNDKAWFEENHTHLQGNEYEQKNKPLYIWQTSDPISEEIRYLLDNGKMTIDENDYEHYFNAFLWGADLSAAKDATVLFYDIDRDEQGNIVDISFNFVTKKDFEESYSYCYEERY